ncbi:MAG: hypothetical protein KatS3mg103_0058 [Phycisphaerales bacterium]|nr:MAG: hypothetical protein KatS3mg103_0058 [Phycisphaerales bacterium]
MRIRLESVPVSDQDQALAFYTQKLGFIKKRDVALGGPDHRFLTVVSPQEPDGTELLLEPSGDHPATKAYKAALYEQGIPITAFQVDDCHAEHRRLEALGVRFVMPPTPMPGSIAATLDDTCGNLVMIYQETPSDPDQASQPQGQAQPSA